MRESPKHTYFIIRAAMTCFFLVVPLFVLRAPLEWMGRMLAADGRITEWIWNQAYPQYMTRANPGGWIRSLFAGEGENGIPDPDPAYRELVRNRQFLEEHPYIKQRLAQAVGGAGGSSGEDAGSGMPGSQNDSSVASRVVTSQSALPVRSGLPVVGREYVREQLADYDFLMKNFYIVHANTTAGRDLMKADEFLSRDFSLDAPGGETDSQGGAPPQILIYHTHGSETIADYGENPEADIIHVGSYLAELLAAKGYSVIHDTSRYDMYGGELDRSQAYTYSLDGVTKILQENPSIQVVLDVHRDGVAEETHLVTEIDGKPTAQIMFFNGTSQTPEGPIEYLPNPNLENNLAFSFQLKLCAEAYFPGFTRKIYLKGLRYNLHLRGRSALIEVGAQNNTYEEARNAMEPLSELLDMVLRGE